MTVRQASRTLLVLLLALPSGRAFNFQNLLYQVHVCPHLPLCPPPMCGPGIKIHECHGKYKQCSQDDPGCDFARCKAGDTGCYFSCEEGICQQIYQCKEEEDCSTTYSYGKCNDPRCNYISVSGSGSGGSGSGSSGSGSSSGSSSGNSSGSGSGSGSVSASGSSSSSGGSQISQAATTNAGSITSSQSSSAKTWMTVISLVAVALVASLILANVLLHRNGKKKPDHALTGSLDRRMRLFTRGVPNFSRKPPVDASSYQLEQDDQVV